MFLHKLKEMSRKGRVTLGSLIATIMVVTFSVIGTAPASASMGGCTGPRLDLNQQDICVVIQTGAKDSASHRQWLSWAQASEPHPAPDEFLELWGDGFYYSGYGTSLTRSVNKWLRSGTNVCAAETDHEGVREIACMHITA